MSDPEKIFQKALNKAADLLARRNHSEKELRDKLSKFFETEVIDRVVEESRERRWLLPPEELAELAAKNWGRAQKSARYIQAQLRRRGLPTVNLDEEEEIQKMKELLKKKFQNLELDYEQRVKAFRYLQYRGFAEGLIRKVIHGDF